MTHVTEALRMDDKAEATLLPCPFCGNKDLTIQSNGIGDFYVICMNLDDETQMQCGARSSQRSCETKRGAADRWNRRVRAPAADGEVERLRGLLVEAVNTFSLIERDGATPSRTLNALADVPLRIRKALGILGE